MKLALLCHEHPDAKYHALIREEELTPTDYRSRCFVAFVEAGEELTTCPRCHAVHRHTAEISA